MWGGRHGRPAAPYAGSEALPLASCPPLQPLQPGPPLPRLPAEDGELLQDDGAASRRRRDARAPRQDDPPQALHEKRRLATVRVLQRNLVYVVGLTMAVCREEVRWSRPRFPRWERALHFCSGDSADQR